jgi:hypothetical protein
LNGSPRRIRSLQDERTYHYGNDLVKPKESKPVTIAYG